MALKPLPIPASPDPYEVQSREAFYDCPWIRIRKDAFSHRAGAEGTYTVVGFHRTACGVLALDDGDRVVLVGQWRYPLETYSWEIPEGGGEVDESPFDAMRRELAEEAGLQARVWEPLLYFNPSNSTTDEETFLFLANGLSPTQGHAEPDEELVLHREPFADCLRRVFSGEIADSLTVAALLALQARRSGVMEPMDAALAERFFQKPSEHPSPGRARWSAL
ncbi:MAG: NUDIX hydrolase [Acidobacteria bacterium]|nr:NUDIX hydrolase [Acidobacteriota bacterium]